MDKLVNWRGPIEALATLDGPMVERLLLGRAMFLAIRSALLGETMSCLL